MLAFYQTKYLPAIQTGLILTLYLFIYLFIYFIESCIIRKSPI
jgi:hypothetical protein